MVIYFSRNYNIVPVDAATQYMAKTKNTRKNIYEDSLSGDDEFRLLVESLEEYAIFVLDKAGTIKSWNKGAEKIFGYKDKEAIGRNAKIIFRNEDIAKKIPELELSTAAKYGQADDERRHIRKNGEEFWSSGIMSAIRDAKGNLRGFAKVCRDITQRVKDDELIRHQAMHDPLTGLLNRKAFETRVLFELPRIRKSKTKAAIFLIDLDDFKTVNDDHGHDTGDLYLKNIAIKLSKIIRRGDILARFGGDEFVMFFSNLKKLDGVKEIVAKIIKTIGAKVSLNNRTFKPRASIGVSLYPDDAKTYSTLLKLADIALYRAKDAGKNSFKMFKEVKSRKAVTLRSYEKLRHSVTT